MWDKKEDIIARTIDAMKPLMRRAVVLYYYNQLSVTEIAEVLNRKPPEIYELITKGRSILRMAVISDHGEEKLFQNNIYLYTEIFLSCSEEAVKVAENKF